MLQDLSNEMLVNRFSKLVRTERKITHQIVACIAEIEIRKIYLAKAYPTLCEYLMHEHGYSQSSALRRIDAALLLQDVPEVSQKIVEGKINLSQASLLAQTIRLAERNFRAAVTSEQKFEILQKIESRNYQDSQRIICQELGVAPLTHEKRQTHADGSVTLTITLTAEQAQRFQRVGELALHALESTKSADLIDYLACKELARRTEVKRASPLSKSSSQNQRLIPPNVRKLILHSSTPPTAAPTDSVAISDSQKTAEACSYRNSQTGRRCGSRHFVQIDHRRPVRAGGNCVPDNLQILCAAPLLSGLI